MLDEARLALKENKLVPLRIDMALLPLGFRSIHTIDLSSWTRETEAEPFQRLIKDLGHYLDPANSPSSMEATVPEPSVSTGDAAVAQAAYDRGDYTTALSLARPAAQHGDQVALYILGLLYRNGQGVPRDYAEAAHWYRRPPTRGTPRHRNDLGLLYRKGQGVPAGLHRGGALVPQGRRPRTRRGANRSRHAVPERRGVPQDYAEAARWFRRPPTRDMPQPRAVSAGCTRTARACRRTTPRRRAGSARPPTRETPRRRSNLGMLYQNGQGVPQDYAEAVRWFRKAADQGHARPSTVSARCTRTAEGVPQDYAEAVRWFRKAADQGNAMAQNDLGVLYQNGQGVPQDYCRGGALVPKGRRPGTCPGPGQSRTVVPERRRRAAGPRRGGALVPKGRRPGTSTWRR